MAVRGRLEQTIVQDVPQRFGQGAQHLLLGLPHGGVWVKTQTFLQERETEMQLSLKQRRLHLNNYGTLRKSDEQPVCPPCDTSHDL